MKRKNFSVLLLVVLLLSACGPTATPTPTPPPTATPTPAPSPTPTPFREVMDVDSLPLPPPRLLYYDPPAGEELPLDGAVELIFDQPMDRDSVEAALALSPKVMGEVQWKNDRTLFFSPQEVWERGRKYVLQLSTQARNVEGTPLEEPVSLTFQTVGYLQVTEVQPSPGATDLDPYTSVTVVFNRPIVPLTAVAQQEGLPVPLTFTPEIPGKGEWLNTSVYFFRPEEGFLPATTYEARVAAGLQGILGGVLAEDYVWTFSILDPAVHTYQPPWKTAYAAPTETVQITFNQPMDHASVEERLFLQVDGQPVPGTFQWVGGATPFATETVTFVPNVPFPRDANVRAVLAAGALSRNGARHISTQTEWAFHVVAEPGLVRISPYPGLTNVDVYTSVKVDFRSPMRTGVFTDYLTINPPITDVYVYWGNSDTTAHIHFPKDPRTTYTVTIDAAAPDKYGLPLGETGQTHFTTGDLFPYAMLRGRGYENFFNAYEETYLYLETRNVPSAQFQLYSLDTDTWLGLVYHSYHDDFTPSVDNLVRSWELKIDDRPNYSVLTRVDLTDAEGNPLPPGIYYLTVTDPVVPGERQAVLVKSHLNLTLKRGENEVLVWATDLANGEPVADLSFDCYTSRYDFTSGRTDPNGVGWIKGLLRNREEYGVVVIAGQPGEENFAVAHDHWDEGIDPYQFNLDADYYDVRGYTGYLYTDRPIYRPGQTVYFRGILRGKDDATYTLPKVSQVFVTIQDPQGKEVYRTDLSLNDLGTFNDAFLLDEEAPLGTYYLYARVGRNTYGSTTFRVAEYRKPEYQVEVAADRDHYVVGGTISVNVNASYYSGGPVSDSEVNWAVLTQDYAFQYRCPPGKPCPRYCWSDEEWRWYWYYEEYGREEYGELIAQGTTQTDAQGQALFQVPAETVEGKSQILTLEASVTDINNQQVSNRTAVVVHQGEFYIGIAPRGYVAQAGKEQTLDLLTVDWESAPVAGVPLTVVLMERHWYSVREADEYGYAYWTWTVEDTPIYTTTVTTDAEGQAEVALVPPRGGSYRVRAIGQDGRGNEIRSSAFFWAWSGEPVYWRRENNNRIELIPDQDEYQVGDTARILIPSPYTDTVYALVTLERGHIMDYRVLTITGTSHLLEIPITEGHVPNLFVSVVLVQGSAQAPDGLASFRMGIANLFVSTESKELHITLTPDKTMEAGEHYRPRETAVYDVLTTDHEGNPVAAELSLRLADLAVLALAEEAGPTQLEHFWYRRGLGVRTGLPLTVALEPLNRELEPGRKGGGGGGEEGVAGIIRTRFADTAYWNPTVRTGPDGRAQVTVELPDDLTIWRMQARGITADTLVGRVEVDIQSTLDLLLRPLLPRFFIVGDRAEIATIVHNNTSEDLEVEVHLAAEGLTLEGSDRVTVAIPAGEKARVPWPVTVQGVTQTVVLMEVRGGEYYDGRQDTLPVYRYSTPEVVATAGHLSEPGLRQEIVQLPPVFDPTQGDLTVQVDGSLTAATKDALTYLKHYPYECIEQTVSRFLPNVLTLHALEEMDLERPGLRRALEEQIAVARQQLYARQCSDGSWGWWGCRYPDSYITAYALHGLLEAGRAGFAVDATVMSRAANYLRSNLYPSTELNASWKANRQAYILYVLAAYAHLREASPGSAVSAGAVNLFEKRHLLDQYGKATLAVALALIEGENSARAHTLLDEVAGDAIRSATGTHWQEDKPDYWNMNTDIRSTAIVIWAFSRLRPESDILPNAVRWLMSVRKEGYWSNTQTTAWSLIGLVAYMRASGELRGDFDYSVYLNGELWGQDRITPQEIDRHHILKAEIAQLLVEEGNHLVIQRHEPVEDQTGEGQLYYTVHLRYFLPAEEVKALDRGIIVSRQYTPVDDPETAITSAQVGEVVRVQLTLVAPTDLYYVVVEDWLPAGAEAIDTSLKTASVAGERPELRNLTAEEEYRWYRWYGWGWWWFGHTEMRDEKVVLFARYLPRGTYQYTYTMRTTVPGQFKVLPTLAYEMYFPEVWGRSDGELFTIGE